MISTVHYIEFFDEEDSSNAPRGMYGYSKFGLKFVARRASSQLLNTLPLRTIPGAGSTERKGRSAVIEVGGFALGGTLCSGLQRSITDAPRF